MLGLSSPAEREHIESEYFEDDDAFEQMLTAEDDLIDAYAHGELSGEERRRFEKRFVSSLRGRDRVQFARAFEGAVSSTRPVETKPSGTLFDKFQSPGLLRAASIAAVIVFVAVLAWLVNDRRRMTDELRELRAELSRRTEAVHRNGDIERTRGAEIASQAANLRAQRDTQAATVGNASVRRETIQLPPEALKPLALSTLQPATTRDGHVTNGRADQANVPLDGVDVNEPLYTYLMPLNTISSGGSTVRGTVKDPSGNVVSGATVTLTDPVRNFTRTQSTNKDGAYVFNEVPPGTYSVEVTARGFKTALVSGLALVDTPTVRDVPLEIGAVSETVAVTAPAEAAINTSDATLGNNFERKHITELPLEVNNIVGLLSLQPRTDFITGGRSDQSNITLGGVDATTRIPGFLRWIKFQLTLETAATHQEYRITISRTDGRLVTSVDWSEPLPQNQTIIDTPFISTGDLASGDYVLLLMGKDPDGSFVKIAEFPFKVMKY